jgi:hypothetical protein
MNARKMSPRQEYRREESRRVDDSVTLAAKFLALKSLTVELAQFGPEGLNKISEMKYMVNLAHAKSLFRIHCSNPECVGGDFDLSADLTSAVGNRQSTVSGELVCRGWRAKGLIDREQCRNILRYRLKLGY